jgi:hypothetical protein
VASEGATASATAAELTAAAKKPLLSAAPAPAAVMRTVVCWRLLHAVCCNLGATKPAAGFAAPQSRHATAAAALILCRDEVNEAKAI